MRRVVETLASADEVARTAAELLTARADDALRARGKFVLALSGGSTPEQLYHLLARPPYRARIDWSRVEFFWSDERAVGPTDPQSNFHLANETLLAPLGIAPQRVHRMHGEAADLDSAARAYETEIQQIAGSPPRFDLVLLGMGADGHTASLFPGSAALEVNDRWVVASTGPPPIERRLSFTLTLINRAACVVFLVAGASKRPVLEQILRDVPVVPALPAARVAPADGELIWLIDRAAGGRELS